MKKTKEDEKYLTEGDVVMLKSGGPKMTLYSIYNGVNYWCKWWDKDYMKFREKAFIEIELKKV